MSRTSTHDQLLSAVYSGRCCSRQVPAHRCAGEGSDPQDTDDFALRALNIAVLHAEAETCRTRGTAVERVPARRGTQDRLSRLRSRAHP